MVIEECLVKQPPNPVCSNLDLSPLRALLGDMEVRLRTLGARRISALLPADATPDDPASWVDVSEVIRAVADRGVPHTLLLLDSARAGEWQAFGNALSHLILPASLLGYFSLAYISRMTRSFMINELQQQYERAIIEAPAIAARLPISDHPLLDRVGDAAGRIAAQLLAHRRVRAARDQVLQLPGVFLEVVKLVVRRHTARLGHDTIGERPQCGELLAFDPAGEPAIAYTDGLTVRLARFDGSSWSSTFVATSGGLTWPSLAFGPGGELYSGAGDATVLAWDLRLAKPPAKGK